MRARADTLRRRWVPSALRRKMAGPMPAARWTTTPYSVADADRLSSELGVSPTLASILVRRGHSTPDAARAFLAAEDRHDPFLIDGMREVCELILGHVERGSPITVHGDYDVDGVCSTAVLLNALRALGGDPRWHLPARADGYGLSLATVERLADEGTGLLITVDCAVTAVEEVAAARARGMDVVVTDHHRPGDRLPDCPVLHPALGAYPFPDLCAAGVAHKLAQALHSTAGHDPAAADEDLDLVALATVADVVPLRGENRRLVREGLVSLAGTRKVGLRALMKIARVEPGTVDAHTIGFRLAPRLNAAGRLRRADGALELLMTADEDRGEQVADELDLMNRERQDTETRIMFAAEAARAEQADAPAYVLAGEGWHPGVIGIVASRMVERYHRPCVLIALDGDGGRGSGRSIGPYDLHAGLAASSEHLRRFGGHRAAAGFDIDRSQVDAFREAFVAHAAASLSPEDLIPRERIDAVVPGDVLGAELAEELAQLAPFGHRNPRPTLLVPAARVTEVRAMGQEGQHSRFTLSGGGSRASAVAFRTAAASLPRDSEERHDAAVRLELNVWNGVVEPRLVLRALCPTERVECDLPGAEQPLWTAVERELRAPLEDAGADRAPAASPTRAVRDRRGQGFAGVCGELVSSGERVLVVCADVARRREGLERLVAGISERVDTGADASSPACARLGVASWDALAAEPGLGERYEHLLALDPPLEPGGERLLAQVPGRGFAHLAWGAEEAEFALAVARHTLEVRDELKALYRDLKREPVLEGERLEAVLRGGGAHPRSPELAGRLVRVLSELGLAQVEGVAASPRLRLADHPPRTELERSPAYVAYRRRLEQAEKYLGKEAPAARAA